MRMFLNIRGLLCFDFLFWFSVNWVSNVNSFDKMIGRTQRHLIVLFFLFFAENVHIWKIRAPGLGLLAQDAHSRDATEDEHDAWNGRLDLLSFLYIYGLN